jgi:hypothetical protein
MDDLMNKIATLVESEVNARCQEHVAQTTQTKVLRDIATLVGVSEQVADFEAATVDAVREIQSNLVQVRQERDAALLKLLEVRKVVAEDIAKVAKVVVDEVEGFRVGDLVRYSQITSDYKYLPIVKFQGTKAVYITHSGAASYENVIEVTELRRKPVEVGDTVRAEGKPMSTFVVKSYEYDDEGRKMVRCQESPFSSDLTLTSRLIAIAAK